MNLYVSDYGAKIGINNGNITVSEKENTIDIPIGFVDAVSIYPGVCVSQQAIRALSENKKNIFWVGGNEEVYACITFPSQADVTRQKKQFVMSDDGDFSLAMAKRWIFGKISNQLTVVRRLSRQYDIEIPAEEIRILKNNLKKSEKTDSVEEVSGVEGYSARVYFSILRRFLPDGFRFEKRIKNPPKDNMNALLSFLYSLLYRDITKEIQYTGLNPQIGVMHTLSDGHNALSSDMMEEFRPFVCDSVAVRLVNSHKITRDDFIANEDGSVYLTRNGKNTVLEAYHLKIIEKLSYVKKDGVGNSIKDLFSVQAYEFLSALENENAERYNTIILR